MALNNLQQFLLDNRRADTKTVNLYGRLADCDFTIRAISMKENNLFNRLSYVKDKKSGKQNFDGTKYLEKVVIAGLVEPNLKDAAFIQEAGVNTAEDLLNLVFLPGEVAQLGDLILEYSGYGEGEEEEYTEEVENFSE